MDKKNTMLLTVIAVATLLVAVVGATFAYFAVSVTGDGSTSTNVTGSTSEAPGTVTFATTASDLYLKLSAADMSKTAAGSLGKKYYAVTDQDSRGETETPVGIFTATVDGGPKTQKYSCTGDVKVTLSGTMDSAALTAANATLTFAGLQHADATKSLGTVETEYTLTGAKFEVTEGTPLSVTALLMLENTASDQTTALAGKQLSATISLEKGVTCEPVA